VLDIRASGICSHGKNSSLLIYATRVSIWTNSQCFCFSLPLFALYAHASKEKGLNDEEDGDRCSFKIPGCHIIFFQTVFLNDDHWMLADDSLNALLERTFQNKKRNVS